jgi:hypothetical protein
MTIEDIRTVRAELQKFDARQTDFAVRFHIAVVDTNLRAAAEGHDGPFFRESLAICVRQLAACVSGRRSVALQMLLIGRSTPHVLVKDVLDVGAERPSVLLGQLLQLGL